MPRSPKGLISNTSVTPEEMAQLGCPEDLIAFWKRFAELHIEANPATDDTLDRTAAAKALFDNARFIECSVAAAQRNPESGRFYALGIHHGMLFASRAHQLAIIDNETSIVARQESIEGARRGGRCRSAKIRNRNRDMALEFLKRRGGRKGNTALMVEIGAAKELKPRASIYAINSGLKDLNRD
jgi:hypothetical protein